MSESKNVEWELLPFENIFLERRDEILKLVGITSYALRSMGGMTRLSEVLGHSEKEVEQAKKLEEQAKSEVENDLPILHNAASVLLWGALEASIKDFIVRWMTINRWALEVPELGNLKVRVADYEKLDGENKMRYLFGLFEREIGASLKPGIGRFDCLLKPLNVKPKTSQKTRNALNELAATRNVIVHRAGIVDERLLELCPLLKLDVGSPVFVGSKKFEEYVKECSEYVIGIIETVRNINSKLKDSDETA
jgi:hypothetical protein